MHEFLSTWYGLTLFIAFDVLAAFALIAICYRVFFKRFFDILSALICLVVCSPVFLIVYAKYRAYKNEGGEIAGFLHVDPIVGKKGHTVARTGFESKTVTGEVAGAYGRWLEKGKLQSLPRLLDVLFGRATFIGVSPLRFQDAAFLDDIQERRYGVRVGLISPLKRHAKEAAVEERLDAEAEYAVSYTVFTDMKVFFGWLLSAIRGGRDEAPESLSYARDLCERGLILQEEYDSVLESAIAEEAEWKQKRMKGE